MKAKFIAAALAVSLAGCASTGTTLTPMQIQAMQQKDFEVEKKVLFASVVSVFQDLGYQVTAADLDTGFINATSNSERSTNFWEAMGGGASTKQVRGTAYIEQLNPTMSRVRLNFVQAKNVSTLYGQEESTSDSILDAQLYQNAFERIDEAVFVRTSTS
ncbi:hypothetical protein [Pacificimonas flava]|uniref:Lipoprotein n=1 Tax=Pacificimonas flava TaxID=1234595 RepID=M2S7Q1_9SPHN|nr:hypothetical protein [Pacificimonas flava]EMD81580.1 hypothetical protein C725_3046 [Pacificimonas flava]MBB5281866.1 type IV pilus biogenesis protein CpaD/CtpE [Pacificimonas flava]